jgi:type IV pilus assembly protein PilB
MATNNAIPLSGLARRLVKDGILNEAEAQQSYQNATAEKTPYVTYLVKQGLAEGAAIARAASDEFGTPYFDLKTYNTDFLPKDIVAEKLIRRHHTLPLFQRGKRLFIALSDPTNLRALDEIKFHTGLSTEAVLVEEEPLQEAIASFLESQEESYSQGLDDSKPDEDDSDTDDAPIVRYVNKLLLDAIKGGASDIHFEPYEKTYRIRFRTDGVLHEVTKPPINLASRLAARLKVMSQMDISERRIPQDGRIKLKITKTRSIDFRVNTLPTLWGEKIVLRILDPSSAKMGIDQLGYEPTQKDMYMKALSEPQGMILVTGPTGSGKTVSLYTGLNILNTAERNIATAEDPVEINMEGINQVHVNNKVGLNFATALRSFLRQDPDVIMVGEIRDLETAEIGIKAAQTGHLVLSTLHTNSAAETITRLLNMGVAPFNLATTLNLIIAQRLARRLCGHCAVLASEVPRDVLLQEGFSEEDINDEGFRLMHPNAKGCNKCHQGYKGRVGIYEVVRITPMVSKLILEGANALGLQDQFKAEGFSDLRRSALKKAAQGVTSLEEVNRVTKD